MNYTPFVYLLKFIPTGQLYYGSRTAKNCQITDLWTKYFTSSKMVKKLIEAHGKDSFEYEVRKTFSTRDKTLKMGNEILEAGRRRKEP